MGGAASSAMDDVHLDDEEDPSAWLSLRFVTDNGVRFNSRTLNICSAADSSLLQVNEDVITNRGYWWEHDHVPTERDDDDNLNEAMHMTPKKLEDVKYFIKQAGLTSSYSEHFACPREMSPDAVFVTIRLILKSKNNREGAITSLSGCIEKEELNVPFIGCSDKATRGAWIYRARELLPGPRFESVHLDIRNWWNKVEKLCEAASNSDELYRRRAEYFSFATKRSQAFSHALQYGEGTPKGDEHMMMVDHWKAEGDKALTNVSKCLLDKLFDEGKLLVADVVKDKFAAFEKLESLKTLLHDEFMSSLLNLGDQIEQHERDAWTSFHHRFNKERRSSAINAPRKRQASVLLIKQNLSLPPEPKRSLSNKKIVMIEDSLLGSSKRYIDVNSSDAESRSSSTIQSSSTSASPLMVLKKKKESKKGGVKRIGLAPLAENEEKTDHTVEDRVKLMVLNMTASATQNTTKAKLTQRLALVKAQKTRQENEAFVIGAKAHFECLLFDLCINAKMLDYMDRERAVLENKIFNQISTVKKAQSIKHSKDLGHAIKEGKSDKEILELEVDLQKRKEKLHNKLNHRKDRKRKEFEDAKAVTLGILKEKIENINIESTTATLTPTASAKLKGISLMYKALQSRE
mmetsp:Transcript_25040/g.42323  ORF Transcript_25040/g.42323 Transcript_25040/m.42323 type:complete len:632 (-) Transcript_25040:242-2137(-)